MAAKYITKNTTSFFCENCKTRWNTLFISHLAYRTVVKERCRNCHPKQIDIISSEFPKTAYLLGAISEQESVVGYHDVQRMCSEFNSSRSLILVDSKFPQVSYLDEFSIFRLEQGDKVEVLTDGRLEEIEVRDNNKKARTVSISSHSPPADQNILELSHQEMFQKGARVVLENYKEKESWLKRCELQEDFRFTNADWEIVNEFAEVGDLNVIRLIKAPEQIVKSLEHLAAEYRTNLLRRSNHCMMKKDALVKETVASLLWKRRLTEEKFIMGVFSEHQRNQELEMYEKALKSCFHRTSNEERRISRSQRAKTFVKAPFLTFKAKVRRYRSGDSM